jgi:hypothetical protein
MHRWHTQKADEHTRDGRTVAPQTGSQKTPAVAHDRRHGRTQGAATAATTAQGSAPRTTTARQKRGAKGHRSRAQKAAQTPPANKTRAHLTNHSKHGHPTLTESPKRPPAPTGANRPTELPTTWRVWKGPRNRRKQMVVTGKRLSARKLPGELVTISSTEMHSPWRRGQPTHVDDALRTLLDSEEQRSRHDHAG